MSDASATHFDGIAIGCGCSLGLALLAAVSAWRVLDGDAVFRCQTGPLDPCQLRALRFEEPLLGIDKHTVVVPENCAFFVQGQEL
ncbi:MAG: hypothetical protein ACKVIY_00035 [Acidimicrobiales bacterium]